MKDDDEARFLEETSSKLRAQQWVRLGGYYTPLLGFSFSIGVYLGSSWYGVKSVPLKLMLAIPNLFVGMKSS